MPGPSSRPAALGQPGKHCVMTALRRRPSAGGASVPAAPPSLSLRVGQGREKPPHSSRKVYHHVPVHLLAPAPALSLERKTQCAHGPGGDDRVHCGAPFLEAKWGTADPHVRNHLPALRGIYLMLIKAEPPKDTKTATGSTSLQQVPCFGPGMVMFFLLLLCPYYKWGNWGQTGKGSP